VAARTNQVAFVMVIVADEDTRSHSIAQVIRRHGGSDAEELRKKIDRGR